MKFFSLLFLFFSLAPFVTEAKVDQKEFEKQRDLLISYAAEVDFLRIEAAKCSENEQEKIISLLDKTINSCQQAIHILDKLFEEFNNLPKKKHWQDTALLICQKFRKDFSNALETCTFLANRHKWNLCVERINQKSGPIQQKNEEIQQKLSLTQNQSDVQKIQTFAEIIKLLEELIQLHTESLHAISQMSDPVAHQGIAPLKANIETSLQDKRNTHTVLKAELFRLEEFEKSKVFREEAFALFEEAKKKGELASKITKELYDPNKLVKTELAIPLLQEATNLYQEAANDCKKAISLIDPFHLPNDKNIFLEAARNFEEAVGFCLQEISIWPQKEETYRKNQIALDEEKEEIATTEISQRQTAGEFFQQEKRRKESFYKMFSFQEGKKDFSFDFIRKVFSLDQEIKCSQKDSHLNYLLFTEQFYRFLIPSLNSDSKFYIKVYEKDHLVHIEEILLPSKNLNESLLYQEKYILIPKTKLRTDFQLDLRLRFFPIDDHTLDLVLSHRGKNSDYRFSVCINEEELYSFDLLDSPPWQLKTFKNPQLSNQSDYTASPNLPKPGSQTSGNSLELASNPILDQFVMEMNNDPLAIAQYVQNEIELFDPFLFIEEGRLQPPPIHRSAFGTFMEKQGSAWEQCALLIYLLRKAGYEAFYAQGNECSLPPVVVETMLNCKLPQSEKIGLNYPFVLFFDGSNWISLFPWLKEMIVQDGFDLYGVLPDEFSSAEWWILQYLTNEEEILKHIGPDGDDTTALLFIRYLNEELRNQGLSLFDVGRYARISKKQYSKWAEFPRADVQGEILTFSNLLDKPHLFATFAFEISSCENPTKTITLSPVSLVGLNGTFFSIKFIHTESNYYLQLGFPETSTPPIFLELDSLDQTLQVKIRYQGMLGTVQRGIEGEKTFYLAKGTHGALCFNFGASNSTTTSFFINKFNEVNDVEKIDYFLASMGNTYFERCATSEKAMANLHKLNPSTYFGCALAKLAPELNDDPSSPLELKYPQLDVVLFDYRYLEGHLSHLQAIKRFTFDQFSTLATANHSSNEHEILREMFDDPYAISTVKLLQLAHQRHQKEGLPGVGFLTLNKKRLVDLEKMPEVGQNLYFSHIPNLNVRQLKILSKNQWKELQSILDSKNERFEDYAYAYMTPNVIASQNETLHAESSYRGIGTFLFSSGSHASLISDNMMVINGGFGSSLQNKNLSEIMLGDWKNVRPNSLFSPSLSVPRYNENTNLPIATEWIWKPDVRQDHKSYWDTVADPVDVVSGAFYLDEMDLSLPGPFPLELRRNYNNQNSLQGILGHGWKLNLNPFLHREKDKIYATEADGTTIVYRFVADMNRWIVLPEDNPELRNFNKKGIGETANPFHAYIEAISNGYILYGTDGSKRIFDDLCLKEWRDHAGNTLKFIYTNGALTRIESSNGYYLGFHYDHSGKIVEAFSKDGRRIYYSYNYQGDLAQVVLPNGATLAYEYDQFHRIIREGKPHGKILENIYDNQGRVIEQRSPAGFNQQMVSTAQFCYQDQKTIVTDGLGASTEYYLYQNQIYKIVDPQGNTILQSWFIDKDSWFDAEESCVKQWNQDNGWPRSLKASKDKRGLVTEYTYDSKGNPKVISLMGQDLTGDGKSKFSKYFDYNENNLCKRRNMRQGKAYSL